MIQLDFLKEIRHDLKMLDIISESARPQSWKAVRVQDVVTPQYVDDLIQHGGSLDPDRPHPRGNAGAKLKFPFYYEESMPDFHDNKEYPPEFAHLGNLSYSKVKKHPDFRKALETWLPIQFRYVRKRFREEFKYGRRGILGYRAISVTPTVRKTILAGGSLGIYWTYVNDDLRSRWNNEKVKSASEIYLTAEIPEQSVNWIQTYMQNMDWFIGMSESELRLTIDQPIFLTKLEDSRGQSHMITNRTQRWIA